MRKPFSFHQAWVWEDEAWSEGESAREFGKLECGNLKLGDEGCGMYPHLIVTTRERGQVWEFADVGISSTERSFLEWYEDWLDENE